MKSKILLSLTRAEFFDTGHEIESLFCLKGSTIIDVEDSDETVCLTIEHRNPFLIKESVDTTHNKPKPKCAKANKRS